MPPETVLAGAGGSTLFSYRARRNDGSEVVGRTLASGELELDRILQRDGLTLVSLGIDKERGAQSRMRMSRHELVGFTNQLATMVQAGVPLVQSLQHLAAHSRTQQARDVIHSVLRLIEGGANLSEAFQAHPGVFPGTYVAMVKSGELSTSLPEVLRRQGRYMEWISEIRGVTRQAMIYPSALALAVLGLVVILITFLIPRLVGLFPGGYEDLPAQTKFVMRISSFVREYWVLLVAGLAAGGACLSVMLRVRRTRLLLSRLLLGVPRLGAVMNMLAIARFATTASALQQSGCEIVQTLQIAGNACGNTFLGERFAQVLDRVRAGEPISDSMREVGHIDPYLVQMTSVGETSGRFGECLDYVAEEYNREVPRVVKWALGLIEPCVLIFGGIIVAFLLVAAILPIFKIYETL